MTKDNPLVASSPQISVVIICGRNRRTAKDLFAALNRQTCSDDTMEIVVWDVAPDHLPPPPLPGRFVSKYFRQPQSAQWWAMRQEAARFASGGIIAFIEDHCIPADGWAGGLLAEWQSGPRVCVGYSFTDGSGHSWWSQSSLVSDYGRFLHPSPGGPAPFVAGNNVAYSRKFLEEFAPEISTIGGRDFNIQEFIHSRGLPMTIAPTAVVAHRCQQSLIDHLATTFLFVRLLAAARAQSKEWTPASRWLRAAAAPALVPWMQIVRTGRLCWPHPDKRRMFLRSLPLFYLTVLAGACGESAGLLAGPGSSEASFVPMELDAPRI
jgi:hypothetical protein